MNLNTIQKFGVSIPEGKTIFSEGDKAKNLFFILQGEISIFIKTQGGQKKVATLKKGDIFGEMAVVDQTTRSATAIADTNVKALAISLNQLTTIIKQSPEFAIRIVQKLSAKLRETNEQLTSLLAKDKREIVMQELGEYSKKYGQKTFKGPRINLEEFLQSAIGYLGLSRMVIKDVIKDLISSDYIAYGANSKTEIVLLKKLTDTLNH